MKVPMRWVGEALSLGWYYRLVLKTPGREEAQKMTGTGKVTPSG